SMLKGALSYQFSDRIQLRADVNQIAVGRHAGDFLYEATADILLSEQAGRVRLGAYSQNKSPEMVFDLMNYTYHQWDHSWEKTKTQNLSFAYTNSKISFSRKSEDLLMLKDLVFREVD